MINIFESEDKVLAAVADLIVVKAHEAIAQRERFNIALSGGSSPARLYELLASGQFRNRIEWNKVFFFFGDERYVPLSDSNSNYLMAKRTLFQPLSISDAHIFAVNTALTPTEAAHDYEVRLLHHLRIPIVVLISSSWTWRQFAYGVFVSLSTVLHEQKALIKEVCRRG